MPSFTDRLRPGANAAVKTLKAAGMQVELLSGDARSPVRDLADRLGIASWKSGVLPAEKAARVAALSAEGRKVLMVGDGLNDTAALPPRTSRSPPLRRWTPRGSLPTSCSSARTSPHRRRRADPGASPPGGWWRTS